MARKAPRKDVASKNERVLHTRIPAALEDDIKKVADRLRIPVSNLVRNILQDALALATSVQKNVGDRVAEIRDLASPLEAQLRGALLRLRPAAGAQPVGEPATAAKPGAATLADVIAWQPIQLGRVTICAGCDAELAAGSEARLGLTADPSVRLFSCSSCARKQQRASRGASKVSKDND